MRQVQTRRKYLQKLYVIESDYPKCTKNSQKFNNQEANNPIFKMGERPGQAKEDVETADQC